VPWPSAMESAVVGGLMRAVAAVTVALLNLLGTPALQHGNLIETRAGLLGIDEACSGVRSLQATLVAALFLGEFHRFPWARRAALLAVGLAVAFATNVARAYVLAGQAASEGSRAVDRWHDPLGFSVALVCFALVWAVAWVTGRGIGEPPVSPGVPAPRPLPARFICGVGAWILLSLGATELWFRTGELPAPRWTFRWPAPDAVRDFRPLPLEPRAAQMLRCDEERGASWTGANGARWVAYHFRWDAGPARSRILARMHQPENCLPSAGWRLTEDRGTVWVQAGEQTLPFHAMRFEAGGAKAHVWYCLSEDRRAGDSRGVTVGESARAASLRAVLRRERNLGQQVLEAVLLSGVSSEEADAAFRREIAARIQPTVPK
jgi:exosortase/archaeosortase family protein